MRYIGDPRGYSEEELKAARHIREITDCGLKNEMMTSFRETTGKVFPIMEPGTSIIPRKNPFPCLNHLKGDALREFNRAIFSQ